MTLRQSFRHLWRFFVKNFHYHIGQEPNLLIFDDHLTVVGDIHGQYYDLMRIMDADVGGDP